MINLEFYVNLKTIESKEYSSFSLACSVSLTKISDLKNLKTYDNYFVKLRDEILFFRNNSQKVSVFVVKITEIDYLKFERETYSISFVSIIY